MVGWVPARSARPSARLLIVVVAVIVAALLPTAVLARDSVAGRPAVSIATTKPKAPTHMKLSAPHYYHGTCFDESAGTRQSSIDCVRYRVSWTDVATNEKGYRALVELGNACFEGCPGDIWWTYFKYRDLKANSTQVSVRLRRYYAGTSDPLTYQFGACPFNSAGHPGLAKCVRLWNGVPF